MKNLAKIISPAKVNLVLAVGAKRADGFHEVNTIMHTLALHDTLTMRRFEEEEGGLQIALRCETSGGIEPLAIPAEENIAYRAVSELARELGRAENETIQVQIAKVIPAQAGLGGGSSNAAAALVGAAALWGVEQKAPLFSVAARLGADVAFFLHGGCTRLSGKGEVFEASLAPRKEFALLVRPDAGVSTVAAYNAFDVSPELPKEEFLARLATLANAVEVEPYNNLEQAACTVTPQVAEVLSWAKAFPDTQALLCGSGSAVCVICPSYEVASAALLKARRQNWWTRVTSFSPLGAAVIESY